MEIVIWGFGRITRNVIFMLGTKGICAIIDSKAEQFETREYLNIPIITFGEYLEKYRDKYILITPMNYQNIITQLRDNGIYWFFLWNEENITNNIFLEKEQICKKIVDLSKNKKIYISGMSFWGILLYQALCEMETQVSFFDELRHKDFQEKLIRDKHIRVEKKIDIKDAIIINLNKEILELKGDNNIEISVDDLGTWVDRGWKNRLEKYHNVAKENEKIFIVATGPSLQIKDLEKLKEKAAWQLYAGANDVKPEDANQISKYLDEYNKALKYADDDEKEDIHVEDYIPEEYISLFKQSKTTPPSSFWVSL